MSDESFRLAREIEAATMLRERFKEAFADDDEALADMAEGETNLFETMESVLLSMAEDESMLVAIDTRVKTLGERKARFERRIELKKALILSALQISGVKSRAFAEVTVTRKNLPDKALITQEADVPAAYFEPQPPRLNRTLVNAYYRERIKALKEAEAIEDATERAAAKAKVEAAFPALPGVTVSNGGETIQVAWK
jgi:hypothetical protein